MLRSRLPTLWLRLALPFALFVAAGSIGLLWWMNVQVRRENLAVFATLARTNADFVRSARLAPSERTARELGTVLGMRVFFRNAARGGEFVPKPERDLVLLESNLADFKSETPEPYQMANGWDVFVARLDEGMLMFFVRPAGLPGPFLIRGETLAVLAVFWALSFALGWVLTRGLVRPATLLGRMATGLAHEIHNPLSAIRLHAQLLADADESVAVIQSETHRIESLVNQWLFLARPDPPQTAPAALAPLVASVVRAHAAQAAHTSVEVSVEVAETLMVCVDARRISQAIGNVLLNALQAMPRGGNLRITAAPDQPVRLIFADDGPGFSPSALAHAADLFYSEKEGGMGIGLNVTAEILKAHGGALLLANAPGGGAVVTLVFPALP